MRRPRITVCLASSTSMGYRQRRVASHRLESHPTSTPTGAMNVSAQDQSSGRDWCCGPVAKSTNEGGHKSQFGACVRGRVWESMHRTPPTAALLPSVCTVHLCTSLTSSALVTDAPTFALAQGCAENRAHVIVTETTSCFTYVDHKTCVPFTGCARNKQPRLTAVPNRKSVFGTQQV